MQFDSLFLGALLAAFIFGMIFGANGADSYWKNIVKKDYIVKEEAIDILNGLSGAKRASALKLCLLEKEVKENNNDKK